MNASEPLPHFVDDYLAYLQEVLPTAGQSGRRPSPRRPPRGPESAGRRRALRALSGFSRRLHQIDPALSDRYRAGRASDRGRQHRGPDVRARDAADLGAQPAAVRPDRRDEPGQSGAVRLCPGAGTRPPGRLEAAAGVAARPVRARQRQGLPGHFRQGGARSLARRPQVHRKRPAAGVLDVSTTCTFSATWPTPPPRRRPPSTRTSPIWKTDLAPRAKASFRLGREKFEQKLKLEEGITLSAEKLLAIALRELGEPQEEFRTPGRSAQRWRPDRSVAPRQGSPSRSRASW